jgi:hypothetical protein
MHGAVAVRIAKECLARYWNRPHAAMWVEIAAFIILCLFACCLILFFREQQRKAKV